MRARLTCFWPIRKEERNERTIERVSQLWAGFGPGDWPVDVLVDYWREKLLHDPPEHTLLLIEFWASACRDPEIHRRFSEQHERLLATAALPLEDAASRSGVTLPLPALELMRVTSGIAHGLQLEQLMNPDKIDPDVIELAFAPFGDASGPSRRAKQTALHSDGSSTKGASDDGKRRRSGRRDG